MIKSMLNTNEEASVRIFSPPHPTPPLLPEMYKKITLVVVAVD